MCALNDVEFSALASRFLSEHGLDWVESSVRRTVDQGVPVVRKDIAPFGMSAEVARIDDQAEYFSRSVDYTAAFERRGTRKSVEGTRPYTSPEVTQLYLDALYSTLIEPDELASWGKRLLGEDVETVVFASEDGDDRFNVQEVQLDVEGKLDALRHLLESVISRASRP